VSEPVLYRYSFDFPPYAWCRPAATLSPRAPHLITELYAEMTIKTTTDYGDKATDNASAPISAALEAIFGPPYLPTRWRIWPGRINITSRKLKSEGQVGIRREKKFTI
jgi:hypothetical protein